MSVLLVMNDNVKPTCSNFPNHKRELSRFNIQSDSTNSRPNLLRAESEIRRFLDFDRPERDVFRIGQQRSVVFIQKSLNSSERHIRID